MEIVCPNQGGVLYFYNKLLYSHLDKNHFVLEKQREVRRHTGSLPVLAHDANTEVDIILLRQ